MFQSFADDDNKRLNNIEREEYNEASDDDFGGFSTPAAEERVAAQDDTEDHHEESPSSEGILKETVEEEGQSSTIDGEDSPAESNAGVVDETLSSPIATFALEGPLTQDDGFGDFAASETLEITYREQELEKAIQFEAVKEVSLSEEKISVDNDASQEVQRSVLVQQTETEQTDDSAVVEESSRDIEKAEVAAMPGGSSIQVFEASPDETLEHDSNGAELGESNPTDPKSLLTAISDHEDQAEDENDGKEQCDTEGGDIRAHQEFDGVGSLHNVPCIDQNEAVESFIPDVAPEVCGSDAGDSGELPVGQASAQDDLSQERPGRLQVEDGERSGAVTSANDTGSKHSESMTSSTAEAAADLVDGAAGDVEEPSGDEDDFGRFSDFNEASPAKRGDGAEPDDGEEDEEDFGDFTDFNEAPAATEDSDALPSSNRTDDRMNEEQPKTSPESDHASSDPVIDRAERLFAELFADSMPNEADERMSVSRTCVTVENILVSSLLCRVEFSLSDLSS
jgi:hypothetical protein